MPGPLPMPAVPSALPTPPTAKPNPKSSRPEKLHVNFHPHPLKSTKRSHITHLMSSLTPGAAPVDTGLYICADLSFFQRGRKTPFTAQRDANTKRSKWRVQSTSSYDELVAIYARKGYVRATVRDFDGREGVKCSIVLVAEGEAVPEKCWEIKLWREPVKWVVAKWMALGEASREKEAERERREAVDEKEKGFETESLSSEDEKHVKGWS